MQSDRYPVEIVTDGATQITVRALNHKQAFEFLQKLAPHAQQFGQGASLSDLVEKVKLIVLAADEIGRAHV